MTHTRSIALLAACALSAEAGIPVVMGTAFRMYVEASPAPIILSAVAASNTTTAPVTVTLELLTLAGTPVGTSATRTIPASGQIVGYLSDFFPTLPQPFKGILRVSTATGGVSVVALRQRYNERGDYLITTTPPTLETGTGTAATRSFPHIVNGGGYTTQFILFSGTAGQNIRRQHEVLSSERHANAVCVPKRKERKRR